MVREYSFEYEGAVDISFHWSNTMLFYQAKLFDS